MQTRSGKVSSQDGEKEKGNRLSLDEALALKSQESWSDARKSAWKMRKANPNCYFYRFNLPGESQR